MVFRISILAFFVFVTQLSVSAQDYWQQDLKYTINAKLDDLNHTLTADIEIEYLNNSPDDLPFIYMHLWPNAYKDRSTALVKQKLENGSTSLYYASEKRRGFITSLDFKVNGQQVKWDLDSNNIDICKIQLNSPLKSGERIKITTPFKVKFPRGVYSRLGHIGESYQVTQWYPKPAVYDKNGWHQMPYLDMGEFYSEFGTYDVYITLPKNYLVGSTGDLVDGEEEKKWLNEQVGQTMEYLKTVDISPTVGRKKKVIIDDLVFPPSSSETKTLHYHQSKVHDFGWFADKRWHVLKGEVELPHSKRKVDTWVMFTDNEAHLWKNGIEYMNDAIYYYSLWNGDYPYNHATAVDGALSAGGGMEYPNVTVIGASRDAFSLETVIMHEVGHNWFYGILGSNERDHPWMDEGINSFNENRYIETKYPGRKMIGGRLNIRGSKMLDLEHFEHKDTYYLGYLLNSRRNLDQPIEFKSAEYTMINYGTVVYGKTALVFDYLMAYLGNDVMDKAMQAYFEKWKFKHPQPEDLRQVLEEETGKDLSWFFDHMINQNSKIDYKILKVTEAEAGGYVVKIKNITGTVVPFSVSGVADGKAINTVWSEGFEGEGELNIAAGEYENMRIDFLKDIPEDNRRNNTYKMRGVFKKLEPLKLQYLTSLETSEKTQLFWTPMMGWNEYDHTMMGLAFYNSIMPARKFEYAIMPLYSTSTETVLGSAKLGYTWYMNSSTFQNIRLTVGGSRYSNGSTFYRLNQVKANERGMTQANKVKAELGFTFRNSNTRSKVVNRLLLSSYDLLFTSTPSGIELQENQNVSVLTDIEEDYYVKRMAFSHRNGRILNPYSVGLGVEFGQDFVKASLEGTYKVSYKKGRGLDIRFFSGRFLFNDFPNVDDKFAFSMDGNRDYLYDHVFLGRAENDGLSGAQFARNDGGFKNAIQMSHSQTWITAINLQSSTLKGVPISLYTDLGWSSSSHRELVVGLGAAIIVVPSILEIYFPIYTTTGLPYSVYGKNIRFVFNIASLNPFELIRKIPH